MHAQPFVVHADAVAKRAATPGFEEHAGLFQAPLLDRCGSGTGDLQQS